MAYVLVTHQVEDFEKWKGVFDEVAPMRADAGEKTAAIYRDAADGNTITALFEWDSPEKAREYADSARLKTAMRNAGVTSAPQVTFLDAV